MSTASVELRAEVLDQAGQAWGLAGDPVRAMRLPVPLWRSGPMTPIC